MNVKTKDSVQNKLHNWVDYIMPPLSIFASIGSHCNEKVTEYKEK
jgi:hypothetical protein